MNYEESEIVELKEVITEDVKKEICAMLNSFGGVIYIGVKDDGKVVGVMQRDELDTLVSNWISMVFYPSPRSLISLSFNEDNVYEIKIKKGTDKPYFLQKYGMVPNGVYIRCGRSTRKAEMAEIKRMIFDNMTLSGEYYESKISPEQKLTFKDFEIFAKYNNLELEGKFITLGLRNTEGFFTNLGLLLSDQNPYVVKFAVYDDKWDFKVKKEFEGSLVYICDQVLKFADQFNIVSAKIIPGIAQRQEIKSYPGASLREAILNAFCHADYAWRSNIKIEFFKDKCLITSPGGILDGTLDEILRGKQSYRNPKLVNILFRLNFIENYGTGLPRIKEAYQDSSVKEIWDITPNYFRVELPNLNYLQDLVSSDNEVQNGTQNGTQNGIREKKIKIAISEDKVVEMIKENRKISRYELANYFGVSIRTIQRYLDKISSIEFVGKGKNGYWIIKK